uniref:DNA-(apurinic or apyrimidinic site) endonuclease n=1 Tax=Panstrongylus lignarius TaxID=156445 RepID=A0A224XSV7_9HEMI
MPPKGKKPAAKKKTENENSAKHDLSASESSDSDPGNKGAKKKNNSKPKDKNKEDAKKRGAKREAKDMPETKKQKVDLEKPELSDLNFECNKTTKEGEKWNFKISSWNVAGLRAWLKKSGIDYVLKEDPDILCLQETKCPEKKLPSEAKLSGYHMYCCDSQKDGYAGVALYTKEKPLKVTYGLGMKEHDSEGRAITAEYEKFFLVATYVPNAGQGLKTLPKRMKWDEDFRNYLKDLDSKKPVILCGDLNVAHNPIDLANPKTNTKSAGFTQEERDNMTELLKQGFVDTFRHLYPEVSGAYTYWTFIGNARSRNTGWRLDYFVLSERLLYSLCDNVIRSKVYGSDHCPVTLFLHV